MRPIVVYLVIAAAVLAGCIGTVEEGSQTPDGLRQASRSGTSAAGEADGAAPTGQAPQPRLDTGTAYTYQTRGLTAISGEVTLVVQPSSDHAYLLAAKQRPHLAGEIVHDRTWAGPVDASLNPAGAGSQAQLFDWPLADGKTWTFQDDIDLQVTARSDQLATPDGEAPGFEIKGQTDNLTVHYAYAPGVGYLTSYTVASGDDTLVSIELAEVSTSESAVWFQTGPRARACSAFVPDSVKQVEVPAEADSLLAAGWSSRPGRAILHPPAASGSDTLVQDHGEADRWIYDLVEAEEGPWTLATKSQVPAEAQGGRVCLTSIAVTWTSPGGSA